MIALVNFTQSGHFPLLSEWFQWAKLPGFLPGPKHICPRHSSMLITYCITRLLLLLLVFWFWPQHAAHGILVPWRDWNCAPRIGRWILSHWTAMPWTPLFSWFCMHIHYLIRLEMGRRFHLSYLLYPRPPSSNPSELTSAGLGPSINACLSSLPTAFTPKELCLSPVPSGSSPGPLKSPVCVCTRVCASALLSCFPWALRSHLPIEILSFHSWEGGGMSSLPSSFCGMSV